MSSLCLPQKHEAPPVPASSVHPAALVGLGGALGSVARWGVSVALPASNDAEVPWATVTVNLLGALLLGALMAATSTSSMHNDMTLFFGTGLLGGFTTMSAFGFETVRLLQADSTSAAAIYASLNLLAPLMAWLGWSLTQAAT